MTQHREQRGRYPPGKEQERPSLPPGYLQNGYFDEKGHLLPQVVQDWAKAVADSLYHSEPQMGTTQLKGRFFAEVRRLEKRLDATGNFSVIRPEILKLVAYAEDARKKRKVPPLFKQFIEANVRWAAKGEPEFRKGFVNHFECLVGYYPEVRGK